MNWSVFLPSGSSGHSPAAKHSNGRLRRSREVKPRRLRGEHAGLGRGGEERFERAGVVRLGVVEDDHVNALRVHERGEVLEELLREDALDGVNDGDLVAADEVRVVGGAAARRHEVVENLQFRVERADPEDILDDLKGLRSAPQSKAAARRPAITPSGAGS